MRTDISEILQRAAMNLYCDAHTKQSDFYRSKVSFDLNRSVQCFSSNDLPKIESLKAEVDRARRRLTRIGLDVRAFP